MTTPQDSASWYLEDQRLREKRQADEELADWINDLDDRKDGDEC